MDDEVGEQTSLPGEQTSLPGGQPLSPLDRYHEARIEGIFPRRMTPEQQAVLEILLDWMQIVEVYTDDYASPPSVRLLFARQGCAVLDRVAPLLGELDRMHRVLAVLELWGCLNDDAFDGLRESGIEIIRPVCEDIVCASTGSLTGLPLEWLAAVDHPAYGPALLAAAGDVTIQTTDHT